MIRGEIDQYGRPYVGAFIYFRRMGLGQTIRFLVDTGADSTSIHPQDGDEARFHYNRPQHPISISGIGGHVTYYSEPAIVYFIDEPQAHLYFMDVAIAEPTDANRNLPSLLGRDVLRNWKMTYAPMLQTLEFEVLKADYSAPIPE